MNNNEPVILGKIKRGKTGKPLVVLIIFLFAGIFVLFLPTISEYFGDYNILDLAKNGQLIDFFVNHNNYVDKPVRIEKPTQKVEEEHKLINNKTVIEFSNLTLNNFKFTIENISFDVTVSNDLDLENSNYYFVLEKDNKDIMFIKLYGGKNEFKFINKLDSTLEVKGYVKIFKENEYPNVTLNTDEFGLSTLTCEKDSNKYEYDFTNDLLIKIKETDNYNNDNIDEYYKEYQNYTNKVNKINVNNGIANVEENINGFVFTSEIDLNTYNGSLEKNYYSLNTKSNKINFEMKAKGYDCK